MKGEILSGLVVFGLALLVVQPSTGQDYPAKPVRMLAPEAGGGADFLARFVAQGMSARLQQQVIVENRPGSVVIPVEAVMNAAPDGYTILFYSQSVWLQPFLQTVRYEPVRDLAPITLALSTPNLLAVHPSVPATSVRELVALAKRRPGELNYAAGAVGSAVHLSGELFKYLAGVNLVYVPYKGGGPALTGTISGEVTILFATTSSILPHVKSGRLRALGVTSAQPSALAPGLPTVAAAVPGYESGVQFAMFAPGKTPPVIVERLNREISQFLKAPDTRDQLLKAGAEAVGNSPQELAAYIKSDMAIMSKVIKDAGIKSN